MCVCGGGGGGGGVLTALIGRECSQQNWSDTTKQGSGAICPHLRQGGGEAGREGGREGGRE